ncbi:MAG: nucleotidyltransferase family protein [Thermodesulfobacteriota bacterium]
MAIDELVREKREEILRLAAKYGARNVRVFGSVARGEATPESDVDLLVNFEPGTTLIDHSALMRELTNLLGLDVQVVSERGLRPRVKERVMRDAVPL